MIYKINEGRLRIHHELGFTNSQMATEFGISQRMITYCMDKLGLTPNKCLSKISEYDFRACHDEGLTNSQLAKEFEVDSSTITYWIEKLGLRANESLKNHVFNEKVALKLYYQGFSDRQIAKALKIHFNTANRWRTRSKLQANGHVIMEKRVGNYIVRTHARDKIVLDPSIIA